MPQVGSGCRGIDHSLIQLSQHNIVWSARSFVSGFIGVIGEIVILNIVIIGAGPVGATFALLAKSLGLNVSMLEAREGISRESRTLALSYGSREILDRAGAWQPTFGTHWGNHAGMHVGLPQAAEIHSIHNSQKGGFGRAVITREDGGVPALGYVLSYADLQTALDQALIAKSVTVERGAIVSDITETASGAQVSYTHHGIQCSVAADVVVLADGGANLGKVPAILVTEKDYAQTALLGHIQSDTPHNHRAYERFTPEGPAALLPKCDAHSYSLVWVASAEKIEHLKMLDEAGFCAAFQAHFGFRAGRFLTVKDRRSYPLKLRTVSSVVAGHVVVIGNAAQALHPVAGQGFNLGLRDAEELAGMLSTTVANAHAASTALKNYAASRSQDVSRSVGFTDFLVSTFSNDHALNRIPRGVGLALVDILPFARKALARRMLFGALR